jgi:hypothetical protein
MSRCYGRVYNSMEHFWSATDYNPDNSGLFAVARSLLNLYEKVILLSTFNSFHFLESYDSYLQSNLDNDQGIITLDYFGITHTWLSLKVHANLSNSSEINWNLIVPLSSNHYSNISCCIYVSISDTPQLIDCYNDFWPCDLIIFCMKYLLLPRSRRMPTHYMA